MQNFLLGVAMELCMCACHKNHSVGCIKNELNCLLENKMVSTLIWRNVISLYVVPSNI